ncbi:MAG: MobV family relaxase [Prevotellaceae bacterium]|nr:MobV family relaxase [Prevotellaceae bacterium]
MSNSPRAAIHVGAPSKSFSAAEGNEPERRGWDKNTYRLKNQDTNNHYDFSRKHLNFEINLKGEIVPLGSNPIPLHERLIQRCNELGFKPYKDKNNPLGNSDNSPNYTVGIIVSGDHDVLTRLAFGDQNVDFTLQKSNANIILQQGIKDWAMDTYRWACSRWRPENIIAFDVHCDETTPHIHIQTVPVANTKTRGRASVKYVHKDDKLKILSQKEWKKLPEEIRDDFIRTEVERKERECVSYASVWGKDKYAVGRTYYEMHTDYYNKVGRKYGLERGDSLAMLPDEERRERVHKNKAVLEAERQAKESIAKSNKELAIKESYLNAISVKQEDLKVPALNTDSLVKDAIRAIHVELDKPIPAFGQKEWREDRKRAIKGILTGLQDNLIAAREEQKHEIIKLGKSLYLDAMKNANEIAKQNQRLHETNTKLAAQNEKLKDKISSIDETAIRKLRKEKDEEINKLRAIVNGAQSKIDRANDNAYMEKKRADKTEELLREVFSIPEIKDLWNSIQRNKAAFWNQIEIWIKSAISAVYNFAYNHKGIFTDECKQTICQGIIAKAIKDGLDPSDDIQRMNATHNLLEEVSWKGTTEFMSELAVKRTEQLCQEISGTITTAMVEGLILASGGRGACLSGGSGSDNSLSRWDGKKKKSGWER